MRARFVSLIWCACASGWAIGIAPQAFQLDPTILPSIVRVTGAHTETVGGENFRVTERGSGVIVDIRRDGTGNAGWVCVLTADHVAGQQLENPGGQNWRDQEWRLGLGNGTLAGGPWITNTNPGLVFRGPVAGGNRVDLTLLGFRVPDVRVLVAIAPIQPVADRAIALSGYGDDVTLRTNNPLGARYEINRPNANGERYGTRREGPNIIRGLAASEVITIGVVNYQYDAIQSDLRFLRRNRKVIAGAGYFLNGDSGGPTFMRNDAGQWRLAGIHSASHAQDQTGLANGYFMVRETSMQLDVNVWQYRDWLTTNCAIVPEPSSVIILGIGVASVLLLKMRKIG